jgi:hypothetical protein
VLRLTYCKVVLIGDLLHSMMLAVFCYSTCCSTGRRHSRDCQQQTGETMCHLRLVAELCFACWHLACQQQAGETKCRR